MLIFISPSKTFNDDIVSGKPTLFKDKTQELFNQIKNYSKAELKEKFKLSDQLVDEVYNYYHEINTPSMALYRYGGVLYKALDAKTLSFNDNRLFILSGFYGLLEHDHEIIKYRIDYTHRMLGNLYHFWKDSIHTYINQIDDIKIDLTSKEFEVLIPEPKIRIDFTLSDKNISTVLLNKCEVLWLVH